MVVFVLSVLARNPRGEQNPNRTERLRSLSGEADACLFGERCELRDHKNDITDSFIHAESSDLNELVGTPCTLRLWLSVSRL